MAYIAPTIRTTGDLVTAAIWNADIVANEIAINAGAIAIASQAANDVFYASSATQWARLAAGTAGQVLTTQGASTAPSWTTASGESDQIALGVQIFS